MIFLGHLGLTTGAIKKCERLLNTYNYEIDYRVVMLGSVLPDIIDKPIAFLILSNSKVSSRLFGHTLIFSAFLIMFGFIYSLIFRNKNLLLLGISSLIHLVLDSMWLFPKTFLYPLYAVKFPMRLRMGHFPKYLSELYSLPILLIFEVIGGAILIYYFIFSKKHIKIYEFLKYGKL